MTPALSPAQSAELIWQEHAKKHRGWNVHLHAGLEVIKHHLSLGHDASDDELISLAVRTALDDGYELPPSAVKIAR